MKVFVGLEFDVDDIEVLLFFGVEYFDKRGALYDLP